MSAPVLAVRLDSAGDMLVTGPAIRALAGSGRDVVVLAGPLGAATARLLPGVRDVLTWECPWILAEPSPVEAEALRAVVDDVRALDCEEAVVFTSFHQSALPTALLLRMAGLRRVTAVSEDYPGSLLDVRVAPPGDVPEPERALAVARAAGFDLPDGDDGALAVSADLPDVTQLVGSRPYVVAHPGTSAPARAWPEHRCVEAVEALGARGWHVLVTGDPSEAGLCARVAGSTGTALGGRTGLPELAAVLAGASAMVVANTGPAHLAAAVRTPVVSLFAPVVPAGRWAPYGVPRVLLGDQQAACRGSRARECPVPGHPCLSDITATDVVDAVDLLATGPRSRSRRLDLRGTA